MSESIPSTLISALPAATKVSDTDIVVLENGSTTQKITIAQLKEALGINALNTNFKFYSSLSQWYWNEICCMESRLSKFIKSMHK